MILREILLIRFFPSEKNKLRSEILSFRQKDGRIHMGHVTYSNKYCKFIHSIIKQINCWSTPSLRVLEKNHVFFLIQLQKEKLWRRHMLKFSHCLIECQKQNLEWNRWGSKLVVHKNVGMLEVDAIKFWLHKLLQCRIWWTFILAFFHWDNILLR